MTLNDSADSCRRFGLIAYCDGASMSVVNAAMYAPIDASPCDSMYEFALTSSFVAVRIVSVAVSIKTAGLY